MIPRAFVFAGHNPVRAPFVPNYPGPDSRNMNEYSAERRRSPGGTNKRGRDFFNNEAGRGWQMEGP
jgi:hypothetical protein